MLANLRAYFGHTPTASVGAAFAMMSILFGAWITRIPDIQLQAGLSEGQLGLALLGMPIGAMAIMPFMGSLIHRYGAGKVTWISCLLYALSMILPTMVYNMWWLTGALMAVGVCAGSMDVAMNAAAAAIEKQHKKLIMSTSHAMFSMGGMIGAGMGSVIAGLGISSFSHLVTTAIIIIIVAFGLKKHWLGISSFSDESHQWTWPKKSLALLSFIGFCVFLSEGAIADWSSVYLRNTLKGSSFIVGLGYAGYSFTMALGRLYGDIIIPKWGSRTLLGGGGLLASISLGSALFFANPIIAIIGFTLTGVGLSCIVPITFSAAARIPGVSSGGGIAAISSVGYVGFMVGPPCIGFIAEEFGLTFGLCVVALLCLMISLVGLKIKI